MDHFKALGQRDIKGVADTLHFPYGTFEQTNSRSSKRRKPFCDSAAGVGQYDARIRSASPITTWIHQSLVRMMSLAGMEVFNLIPYR